jgi:phosphotriesterase-related protein
LRRLSEASGLNLLTNTGYYGAGANKYLPRHAIEESDDQLARRWIEEARKGVEGSGIKPGFIKIGVDKGPLSDIHRKLLRAAAITHKSTGLTIASHTGDGVAALEQLVALEQEGVSPSAFIWVHAQNESKVEIHLKAAELGAWVEFDGISEQSLDRHVEFVRRMIDRDFVRRVLISMDAGWYHVGEPAGGRYRGYEAAFTLFVPALKKAGTSERQISTLLMDNPRKALEQRVRRVK